MTALVVAGCFAGFLLSSTTGVGGALLMLPLLTLVIPASAAIALSTPVMLFHNAGKVVLLRGDLDRAFLRRTLAGAAPGAAAGAALVGVVPDLWLRRAIALFMFGYVAAQLLPRARLPRPSPLGVVGWGAVTGLTAGLVGAAGPTNAAAMDASGLSRRTFVATGAAISVLLQVVKLPVFVANGALRPGDLPLGALLCATALSAAFAGRALLARLSERVFRAALLGALAALAVALW